MLVDILLNMTIVTLSQLTLQNLTYAYVKINP